MATASPSSALPDVPTLAKAGLDGFDIGTWFGVLAPAATPPEIVRRLDADATRVIRSAEFGRKKAEIGAEPIGDSTEEMARRIRVDTERFAKLVKEANVTVE